MHRNSKRNGRVLQTVEGLEQDAVLVLVWYSLHGGELRVNHCCSLALAISSPATLERTTLLLLHGAEQQRISHRTSNKQIK